MISNITLIIGQHHLPVITKHKKLHWWWTNAYAARMVSGLEMEIMMMPLILILPAALDLEQAGIFQDSVTLHLSDTKRWRASKASRPMMRTTLLATNAKWGRSKLILCHNRKILPPVHRVLLLTWERKSQGHDCCCQNWGILVLQKSPNPN